MTDRAGSRVGVIFLGGRRHCWGVIVLTLEEAYAKWSQELVGYATVLVGGDDAADVVADAFAVLLVRSTQLDQVAAPRGFLFRCVLNSARMHHRSRSRRASREDRAVTQSRRIDPPDTVVDVVEGGAVLLAVGSLSTQQRAIVYFAYWEDLSAAKIADRLGVSVGTVKRQLSRARSRLNKELS